MMLEWVHGGGGEGVGWDETNIKECNKHFIPTDDAKSLPRLTRNLCH
jgi:hypothetical protein